MPNRFFTSDHHFRHENILKFIDDAGERFRPFDSVDEMDERMIERWNSVVKPGDDVVHLGDFSWSTAHTGRILRRLNGTVSTIIIGNHDDAADLVKHFPKVRLWRVYRSEGFVASHFPLMPSQFQHKAPVCVHGHTHQRAVPGPYVNVCVERWDFAPVPLELVLEQARQVSS